MSNFKKILVFVLVAFTASAPCIAGDKVQCPDCSKINQAFFNYFTYDELVSLSNSKKQHGVIAGKLQYILNNPIIDSTISNVPITSLNDDPKIGKYIRVASWNINRGFNLDQIKLLFTDSDKLLSSLKKVNDDDLNKLKEQINVLKNSNIIVLNEVDVGMPRTGYRNVVKEMAETLHYNYTYGVEFLEIDPSHLGLSGYKWSEERYLFPNEEYKVDKAKYKGLHGTAILSKFPILNARILRLPSCYDWYDGEKKRISELETLKRAAAEKVFREEMITEIRQGSRIALIADIAVPGINTPVTVVAVHLENRTTPDCRADQVEHILKDIHYINNPVIMAGDFNTTCSDGSPTGVKKEIAKKLKDPEFIAKSLLLYSLPHSLAINSISTATNFARKFTDPTVRDFPLVAPNQERELFEELSEARFSDGHTFDFRGDKNRTAEGKSGVLANSNERSLKGFVPTYIFERPLGLGKYKLDWIFVKSYLNQPQEKSGSYAFAPHYARTLLEMNYFFNEPLADHAPITVDLPIQEPVKQEKGLKKKKSKQDSENIKMDESTK